MTSTLAKLNCDYPIRVRTKQEDASVVAQDISTVRSIG
jgi:hypothetical protein